MFFNSTWRQPVFIYLFVPACLEAAWLGGSSGRAERLGLILRATGSLWGGRKPANCRPAAYHTGCQSLAPRAAFQLSDTDPTCVCVCVLAYVWHTHTHTQDEKYGNSLCAFLGISLLRRWNETTLQMANCFSVKHVCTSWRKFLNIMLHHILKLLRNENKCDNVGKTRHLITRNKIKLWQMPQFNQLQIFNASLMLILDRPGVLLTSHSSQEQSYLKRKRASSF